MGNFWEKALGIPASQSDPVPRTPPSVWWQEPQSMQNSSSDNHSSALHGTPGQSTEQAIRALQRIPADQMTQEQMEAVAEWELANKPKYNAYCPSCGSENFLPQGTRGPTGNMTVSRCFDCGGSSSTYVQSPEAALGGSGNGVSTPARQTAMGGAAASQYRPGSTGLPASYVPTNQR